MGKIGTALLVMGVICLAEIHPALAGPEVDLWFPDTWKDQNERTREIAQKIGQKSGLNVVPRVARNYPEILTALSEKKPGMAYLGSMVFAVMWSRRLAQPLFQAVDGKHVYAGVMLFPKGGSPEAILRDHPAEIAYAVGATSGEVCAKAATGGKAALGMAGHADAAQAVVSGRAKAAFVKDFWWDDNQPRFPELDSYIVPGISESKNPDNVLLVSTLVSPEIRGMILDAAYHAPEIFNANFIVPMDSSSVDFTLSIMQKAGIDPLTYTWPQ